MWVLHTSVHFGTYLGACLALMFGHAFGHMDGHFGIWACFQAHNDLKSELLSTYTPKHGFDKKKVQPDWTLNYERYIYKLQKNTHFKMICWALLKGRWYTGQKIRQNGQNGLCMPSGISKSAQQIILKCIFF